MLRSESPQDISGQSSDSSFEKSFFESDSDSDDEDVNSKRLFFYSFRWRQETMEDCSSKWS
jgi:hypothetical protein